eukprot:4382694-Ditylum_brightwellii.AAC.1
MSEINPSTQGKADGDLSDKPINISDKSNSKALQMDGGREKQDEEACRVVSLLLGRRICCTLDDGRTAEGKFLCLDR